MGAKLNGIRYQSSRSPEGGNDSLPAVLGDEHEHTELPKLGQTLLTPIVQLQCILHSRHPVIELLPVHTPV